MPIDQAARGCGVSVGMLSKLENGKGVNLEQVLRVLDGLGLTMLVVPKAHGSWLEQPRPMRPSAATRQHGKPTMISGRMDGGPQSTGLVPRL